jgi:hypothetical protein
MGVYVSEEIVLLDCGVLEHELEERELVINVVGWCPLEQVFCGLSSGLSGFSP